MDEAVEPHRGDAPRDPEELEAAGAPANGEIADETTLGAVHLTVADLGRSVDYYETQVGLATLDRDAKTATLGAGTRPLLVLEHLPGATPADGHTGLFHFALLLPERADLARWLAHAAADRVQLTGLSDHFVSEALYLRDPDHHGIEIYWDRPRSHWEGIVSERMTTEPLDVDSLMGELNGAPPDPEQPYGGLPEGTVMGHVHLRVAAIEETVAFYRDVLGFGLMAQLGPYAAFLSAGGYHHHLGANTWESAGASPAPQGSATLTHYTVVLPDDDELASTTHRAASAGATVEDRPDGRLVRDPSGNALLLTTG